MINYKKLLLYSVVISLIVAAASSCRPLKNLNYMQGSFDTAKLKQIKIVEPIIQNGDLLSIIIYSDNPAATSIYNQPVIVTPSGAGSVGSSGVVAGSSGTAPTTPGYPVDEQGNIQVQSAGLFHVSGMTRKQLSDSLVHYFVNGNLLTNPYVNVRFLNYKFTMLGEVNHPGIYSIPGDHVSLFEALGLAGDLTPYARRDSALVIREVNGNREFGRLDLRKPEIMTSPYFYLQQNDVVIVEQTKKKQVANDQVTARNITIAASVVSMVAILLNLFKL